MYDTKFRTVKLKEDLWTIETDLVRSFVILGANKALLVDTGVGDFNYAEAVRSITDLPTIVVNTHGHDDHCGGDRYFKEVFLHEREFKNLAQHDFLKDVKPIAISEGQIFDLGGHSCQVFEAFGHTEGSIAVLDVQNRILFTGDLVAKNPVIMTNDQGNYNNDDYLATMRKLYGMRDRFDAIYPCHGEYPLPPEYLKELGDCVQGVLDGTISGEDYFFRPAEIMPGISGTRYVNGRVSLLYYEAFGDRYVQA